MIVQISNTGAVKLVDADNFARFSVHIDDVRDNLVVIGRRAASTMRFDDADNAWVHVAALRAMKEKPAWQDDISRMIEKAALSGWVSADGSAIKAHIEWSGS